MEEAEEYDDGISTDESTDPTERPDYSLYDMDDTVSFDIEDTPVTFKRSAAFSYKGKRYPVIKWKTLLSKLCDLLYKEDPAILRAMTNEPRQAGKKRVKLSVNKADIHSPVQIAGSNIWVETNRSATDIGKSILILLERYGIPTESVKVYFRRDYACIACRRWSAGRGLSMVGGYKVITLCGSTRFKDAFLEVQKRLTLEGNIVISVGLFGHSGDDEVWDGMDEGTLSKTKEMLDDMHKRKIDMADEIFVINVGGYIGTSTRSEIEYAKATGKGVRYLE